MEENELLTLNRALEIAQAKEIHSEKVSQCNFIEKKKFDDKSRKSNSAFNSETKCLVCGKKGHNKPICRYKDYKCDVCNVKGHLKVVCKKKCQNKFFSN